MVRALARYRELAGEIKLRKKVADLKGLPGSLEEQMGIVAQRLSTAPTSTTTATTARLRL